MSSLNLDVKVVDDLISYAKELYEFYYNDRNNKMGSSFKIRGFTEDDGKSYQQVMSQITQIISQISKFYDEYSLKVSGYRNYTFEKQLNERAFIELKLNVFNEFAKLGDINVIADLDEAISEKIEEVRQLWSIEEIIETSWKEFVGTDNNEAYTRLLEENENLQKRIEEVEAKKHIGGCLGYIPAKKEHLELAFKAHPMLHKVYLRKANEKEL